MNNLAAINLKKIPLGWLAIGLCALAISGIFSVVLAVAWHPSVKSYPIFATLFKRSLIAHVNLSITIWFLCYAFALLSYAPNPKRIILPYLDISAKILMICAILLITIASFSSDAIPVLCNYIPLLIHNNFYIALGLLVACVVLKLLEYFGSGAHAGDGSLLHHSNIICAIILAAALGAFAVSGSQVMSELNFNEDALIYGEMLFWGGGHILQYAWVQLMLIAWVIMLAHALPDFQQSKAIRAIFYSNVVAVATSPIPYVLYPVTSGDFHELFTLLMAWLSGIAPVIFVLYYVISRLSTRAKLLPAYTDMISASLWWSLILFALGGGFAVMINGINVKIPAHYHGSLLGVTVALMGLTFLLLRVHGADAKCCKRLGMWQPALLGIGQVMHIVGLFWSGGYGVQRKSPDQASEAMQLADLPLRIQSSGGGIAIIGGLLFLVICYKMWRNIIKTKNGASL